MKTRATDIPGLRLPTWEEVVFREYHPWDRRHLVIDTVGRTVRQKVDILRKMVLHGRPYPGQPEEWVEPAQQRYG